MTGRRALRWTGVVAASVLAACATARSPIHAPDGWTPVPVSARPISLGLPGGAFLAPGVRYAGGLHLTAPAGSRFGGLSDLLLTDRGGLVTVSDAGDLMRATLVLDGAGRLVGTRDWSLKPLTLPDGAAIRDKADGDAEGLALGPGGDLLVSFERRHRIWSYGPIDRPIDPRPVRHPDTPFGENAGMEGLANASRFDGGGWRVAGEDGGVWDCSPRRCVEVTPPPVAAPEPGSYRITGLEPDPAGDGYFVVERSFTPPLDARARVRRMDQAGRLGPVLIALQLPGTTDNFEGIAAETRGRTTRLYILSDNNFNPLQRTLLLAFDVRSAPTP